MSRAPELPSIWSVLRPSELRRRVARWLGVLVGRIFGPSDPDFMRGDCFYCDGHGCKYCSGGYQPWCQLPDPEDPEETVCAKCVGGKVNSMGDECPNCRHFPEGIKAPFHPRWLPSESPAPNMKVSESAP